MATNERDRLISEEFQKARVKAGMSRDQVAAAMVARGNTAWNRSTVRTVELGTRPLRVTEAVDAGRILHVNLVELADDSYAQRRADFIINRIGDCLYDLEWAMIEARDACREISGPDYENEETEERIDEARAFITAIVDKLGAFGDPDSWDNAAGMIAAGPLYDFVRIQAKHAHLYQDLFDGKISLSAKDGRVIQFPRRDDKAGKEAKDGDTSIGSIGKEGGGSGDDRKGGSSGNEMEGNADGSLMVPSFTLTPAEKMMLGAGNDAFERVEDNRES